MPVVPMRPTAAGAGPVQTSGGPVQKPLALPTIPAPPEPWTLMAAAQMHAEDRLIAKSAEEPAS